MISVGWTNGCAAPRTWSEFGLPTKQTPKEREVESYSYQTLALFKERYKEKQSQKKTRRVYLDLSRKPLELPRKIQRRSSSETVLNPLENRVRASCVFHLFYALRIIELKGVFKLA